MKARSIYTLALAMAGLASGVAYAQISAGNPALSERLDGIRNRVSYLEQGIINSLKTQQEANVNVKKIQALMKLQREERVLGKKRMIELETTVGELEERRGVLNERIDTQQRAVRKSLSELARANNEIPTSTEVDPRDQIEGPRRKVFSNLVEMGLKEVEALKVDLVDSEKLESRIDEEKQQLAFLIQEEKEHESILEFNRQLQLDILRDKHSERIAQLENYRKLKTDESQVEHLIKDFNARVELQETVKNEAVATRSLLQGASCAFAKLKGKLSLPSKGKVISFFGRAFDQKANLYIFKKGVDIDTGKNQPVLAVSAGKIAYSGELPNYGRITIVDHGGHYYSLCGHLGELRKKTGDSVAAGDIIGSTDDSGTPVYFEIRARNIAVNPLQWVSN